MAKTRTVYNIAMEMAPQMHSFTAEESEARRKFFDEPTDEELALYSKMLDETPGLHRVRLGGTQITGEEKTP